MADGRAAHRISRHGLQFFGELFTRGNAFRKDDDVRMFAVRAAPVDAQDDIFHVVRNFGHDDDLRAARDAGIQRDVATAPAHDFNDADAFVRSHRVAQFIDDVETGVDRRIETQSIIGIFEVVVDRAGDADRRDAVFVAQALRALERTVSADDDQPLDAAGIQRLDGLLLPFHRIHFDASGRAEHCAAALDDIGNAAHPHLFHVVVDEPGITLMNAEHFHAEIFRRPHNGPDAGIHARRVAAARQNPDSLHNTYPPDGAKTAPVKFSVCSPIISDRAKKTKCFRMPPQFFGETFIFSKNALLYTITMSFSPR